MHNQSSPLFINETQKSLTKNNVEKISTPITNNSMKKETKIITVQWNVYAYEIHALGDKYGEWEVLRVVCPAFGIDEEMMAEDMPALLETHIEYRLDAQAETKEKKRVTLWLYEGDINYYKSQAQKQWQPYQSLIRQAVKNGREERAWEVF